MGMLSVLPKIERPLKPLLEGISGKTDPALISNTWILSAKGDLLNANML